jgi:ubiquinone/menaquinone biosynthesis C-methylase UbiE
MKNTLFHRVMTEYKYLTMKYWRLSEAGQHWDSVEEYDDINKETYSYFRRFTDGYKLSDPPRNSYVLDICARTGNGALFFWEKRVIGKVLCADFSANMQAICGRRLKEKGIPFQLQLVDTFPLPFKDAEFEVILCFETAEHVPEPDVFIKELGRVIKKGGQLVLTTPNLLWRPAHSLAAIFNLHHSEGPCHFISRGRIHRYLRDSGFDIITEKTTVLIPAGPKFLIKLGEYLEGRIGKSLMDILGLRQIYVCSKK